MSGVRMPIFSRQPSAKARSAAAVEQRALQEAAERGDGDVGGDGPEREDAVALPVAGDERDGPATSCRRARSKTGPAARSGRGRRGRRGRRPRRGGRGARREARWPRGRARTTGRRRVGADGGEVSAPPRGTTLPMARTRLAAVEGGGRVERGDPGVAHDGDAVGGGEDLAEEVRDEDDAAAVGGEAAHVGEELAREHAVERRGGLVEDDERAPGVSVTVKARAISTICRRAMRERRRPRGRGRCRGRGRSRRAMPRISAAARRCQPGPRSAGCMIRPFSATLRFGQSESSWKTQRTPAAWAARTE